MLGETFAPCAAPPLIPLELLKRKELELVLVELPRDVEPRMMKKQKVCVLDNVVSQVQLDSEYECEVSTRPEGIPQAVVMFPDEQGKYRPVKAITAYAKLIKPSKPTQTQRSNVLKTQPREQPKELRRRSHPRPG